jgi:NitT/TauT family transport system ATP-binding protein
VLLVSPSPGRIVDAIDIPLPRPRNIYDPKLVQHAARVADALKGGTAGGAPE